MASLHNLTAAWLPIAWTVTWQMALLATVAWLATRGHRLRAPGVRYALWWLVLAGPLLLAPGRLLVAERGAVLMVPAPLPPAARQAVAGAAQAMASQAMSMTPARQNHPATPGKLAPPLHAADTLFLLWLGGLGVAAMRLLAGQRQVRRLLRYARPWESAGVESLLHDLLLAAGVRRPVSLLCSGDVSSPALLGWRRPVIVIPPGWSEGDLPPVLAHEVAHIRRGDVPAHLLQRLLQAVLFCHPAAWLAGRELVLAREQACDQWAATRMGNELGYAQVLAGVAKRALATPAVGMLGLAEIRSTLLRRVEHLMDGNRTAGIGRPLLLLGVLAIALATLLLAVAFRGPAGPGQAVMIGRVLDLLDRPVAGAQVVMEADGTTNPERYYQGGGQTTGNDGRFRFRVPTIPAIPDSWKGTRVHNYTLSREVAPLHLPPAQRKWGDYGRCWLVARSPDHSLVGWAPVASLRRSAAVTIRMQPWHQVFGGRRAAGSMPLSVARVFPVGPPPAPSLARQFPHVPAVQMPRIVRKGAEHQVYLPPVFREAVSKGGFAPWRGKDYDPALISQYPFSERQAPFGVVGDFNGDRRPDILLDGRARGRAATWVVFATAGRGISVVDLGTGQAGPGPLQSCWSLLPMRDASGQVHARVTSPYEHQDAVLSGDGLIRTHWEKAATLYYYQRGEFRQYAVGD